jgi:hypothetical protein
MPMLAVLVDRWSYGLFRTWLGQSLSEVLALSIRQTQSRARRAEQVWWQQGLSMAGFFLGLKPEGVCGSLPPLFA